MAQAVEYRSQYRYFSANLMIILPEILKKLNDFEYVLEIMGDYTGTMHPRALDIV